MKNRILIILLAVLTIPAAVLAVSAESGLYPIGQYQQPSYPIQQYNQPGQQNPYNYPNYNSPYYNYPYYTAPTPTPTPQPYYYQQPDYQPQPYYQPQPNYQTQPYYYQPQPYYDPNSGFYFYQLPQQPPYNPQPQWPGPGPCGPACQDPNVQVSTQWNKNGTIKLTWVIRNTTAEDWPRANIDIKCISGNHLLENPGRSLWDIPYTVRRGETLSFSVNIRQNVPGSTMTFAMVAGSKTLYTFNVHL